MRFQDVLDALACLKRSGTNDSFERAWSYSSRCMEIKVQPRTIIVILATSQITVIYSVHLISMTSYSSLRQWAIPQLKMNVRNAKNSQQAGIYPILEGEVGLGWFFEWTTLLPDHVFTCQELLFCQWYQVLAWYISLAAGYGYAVADWSISSRTKMLVQWEWLSLLHKWVLQHQENEISCL